MTASSDERAGLCSMSTSHTDVIMAVRATLVRTANNVQSPADANALAQLLEAYTAAKDWFPEPDDHTAVEDAKAPKRAAKTASSDGTEYVDANGSVWRKTLDIVWVCDAIGQWAAPRPENLGKGEFGHLAVRRVGARGMVVALASIDVDNGYPIEVSNDAPGGAQGTRDGIVRLYAHEVDHVFADQLGDPHARGSEGHCFECGRDYSDLETAE